MTAFAPRLSHAVVYLMVLGNVAYAASVQDWRLFRGAYADWRNGITPAQIPSSLVPIPSTKWRAVASSLQSSAGDAFDGNPATRWTSGEAQHPGQFFEVDLGQDTCVAAVELLPGPFSSDYPRQLRVEVSLDEVRWIQVKDMSGMQVRLLRALYSRVEPSIDLVFLPRLARYVRLTQTGSDPFEWWSIAEMRVFADAPDHCRPVAGVTLTSNLLSPQPVTTPILWTAVATGGTAPEFRFWVQPQGGPFTLAQDYSPSNAFTWTPAVAGDYLVVVWVRSSGSSTPFEKDAVATFWVNRAGTP
jgi:hypothetical protein